MVSRRRNRPLVLCSHGLEQVHFDAASQSSRVRLFEIFHDFTLKMQRVDHRALSPEGPSERRIQHFGRSWGDQCGGQQLLVRLCPCARFAKTLNPAPTAPSAPSPRLVCLLNEPSFAFPAPVSHAYAASSAISAMTHTFDRAQLEPFFNETRCYSITIPSSECMLAHDFPPLESSIPSGNASSTCK